MVCNPCGRRSALIKIWAKILLEERLRGPRKVSEIIIVHSDGFNVDLVDMTDSYRPIVFAFVLGLSFILLTVVFHSLIVPLKAIIMNMLSVGAAYGFVVLVFQEGIGAGLFGFQQVSTVEA